MSFPLLNADQIEALRRYNTPTIANAIELFSVRPRHVGFFPHTIRCLLPDLGVMIGYAVTCQTKAAPSEPEDPVASLDGYYRYVASVPGPKVAVGEDLDNPAGLGAQFGEVNATIHQKLGCVGHVTSGCPRDLDEVHALGFHLFGLNPCVSHAYIRVTDFAKPVTIGGVVVEPGALIHADKHGVCLIPHAIAPRLAEACAEVERVERPLLEICRSDDFSLDEYLRRRGQMKAEIRE